MVDSEFLARVGVATAPTDDELSLARARVGAAAPALPDFSDAELAGAAAISAEALLILVAHEVGGKRRYEEVFDRPSWPGGDSGVMVGIGYDLGKRSAEAVAADWSAHVHSGVLTSMQALAGKTGPAASAELNANAEFARSEIPWSAAETVFRTRQVPALVLAAGRAIPTLQELDGDALGAVVSFYRSSGRALDDADGAPAGDVGLLIQLFKENRFEDAPAHLRAMKSGLAPGLAKRREAEAALLQRSFGSGVMGESAGLPTREAIAFELAAASRPDSEDELGEMVRESVDGPMPESAILDWGIDRLTRFGLSLFGQLEWRLKNYICEVDPEALFRADRAQAGADADADVDNEGFDESGGDGASAAERLSDKVQVHLVEILRSIAPGPQGYLYPKVVAYVFRNVFEPMIEEGGAFSLNAVCSTWNATPPEGHHSAAPLGFFAGGLGEPIGDAGEGAETPAPPAAPLPSREKPQNKAPTPARAAARALIKQLRANPTILDEKLKRELLLLIDDDAALGPLDGPSPYDLMDDLNAAIAADPLDRFRVEELSNDLHEALKQAAHKIAPDAALGLIKALIRQRFFGEMSMLADRFLTREPSLLTKIGPRYAQGLVDSGRILAGVAVLQSAIDEMHPENDLGAWRDATARLGRAHKQIYVNHVRNPRDAAFASETLLEHLPKSIALYRAAHESVPAADEATEGDWHWALINRIALLHRARADHQDARDGAEPEALAERLIETIEPTLESVEDDERGWRLASLGEANLALGRLDEAATAFRRYKDLCLAKNHAFAIASTVRQLEEVWRIEAGVEGRGAILTDLKQALAQEEDGVVTLTRAERRNIALAAEEEERRNPDAPMLETRTPDGRMIDYYLMHKIVRLGAAVCALQSRRGALARTEGTGFLVRGSDLSTHLSDDKSYILTNAHVLWDPNRPDAEPHESALTPSTAQILFESAHYDGHTDVYACARVIWQSPFDECDAALVELDKKAPDGVKPLKLGGSNPLNVGSARLAIIGHPQGGSLTVSVAGGLGQMGATLVDFGPRKREGETRYMHYKTPTEPGNSGSPIFDTRGDWSLVGLHHAGFSPQRGLRKLSGKKGRNFANEGIWIHSIRTQLDAALAPNRANAGGKGLFGRRA